MTALAGIWRFDGAPTAADVDGMLAAQARYGGKPCRWSGDGASLGKSLLVPAGRPDQGDVLVSPERGLALAADLRLDNREELAHRLAIGPAELVEQSDSTLLLKMIEAFGEDAVEMLTGDFAFALWDSRARRLMLARDIMGQRPLHFHRGAHLFAFASMPSGLHTLAEVPRAPDLQALGDFMALLPDTGTESFFAGIEKVPAGSIVTVDSSGISMRRFWSPPVDELRLGSAEDYAEALRAELDRAIAAQLAEGPARIASHLSGGLDSGAVTATAARLLSSRGGRVTAYTSVPREGFAGDRLRGLVANEWPLAARVAARHPNIDHLAVPASGSSPIGRLDQYVEIFERPFLNPVNGSWLSAILDDAKGRGFSLLLTGQSGNMSLSYDGLAALPEMLLKRRLRSFARTAGSLLMEGHAFRTVGARAISPLLPRPVWSAIQSARGKPVRLAGSTLLHRSLVTGIERRAADRGFDLSYRPSSDPRSLRLQALSRNDPGNYNKGMLAGWGIDVRDPLGDKRLVELSLRIPAEWFLTGGRPRNLARLVLRDRLPEEVLGERRRGFQAADWHEALASAHSQLVGEVERIAATPEAEALFDLRRLRDLAARWAATDRTGPAAMHRYRLQLLRAVSAGHFLRKASGGDL